MKIQKFNENMSTIANNIVDNIKNKYVGEETYYVLYGIKLYNKNGKLYPTSNIKAEKITSDTNIDMIQRWYETNKSNYDEFFIKKEYVNSKILSQEEIDLLINSSKYNL